ncbi:MAG: dienelactone hydrolase family protein [Burkholderiaceae bacterium]
MSLLEQEVSSHLPTTSFTRRGFVVTALGSGFAAAVMPVSAQTITTDASGLDAGEVKIPVSDGQMPAYRAHPAGKTNLPTIVVIQEVFGVHEHIKDLCRRLAKQGYLAVAPELYARQGDPMKYPAIPDLIKNVVSKVPDAQVAGDLDATVAWAAKNNGNPDKVGATGFCWGGRQTWLFAEHNPRLKAAVAWYGPLENSISEIQPKTVLEQVGQLKAPVLGLYGGKDQGITAASREKMNAALKSAPAIAADSKIIVYPDAQHGFNADYRPSYSKADAEDGWPRMLAFFKAHGVA